MHTACRGTPAQRIVLLDEMRGFAVFCMVVYHAFYTFTFLLGWDFCRSLLDFFTPAEPWFAGLFIFLSGLAGNLTRSNLKRGLKLAIVAVGVSAVTFFAVREQAIYFGILHFLSVSMLLIGLCKRPLNRVPIWVGISLCAVLFLFTMGVEYGYLGIARYPLIDLPRTWYTTNWFMPLGFYNSAFFSSDYFPVFPWIFVFLAGFFFGRYAVQGKFPAWTYRSRVRPLAFLGRHALIVYIVHQPVLYGAGMLFQWLT